MALVAIQEALRRRAWAEARATCEADLASGDDRAETHAALGLALCGEGAFPEAIVPLAAALARDPASPTRARNLAAIYAHLGCWPDVWRVLSPVVDRVDAKAQALFLAAALDTGEAHAAVACLERAGNPASSSDGDLLCDYGRALCVVGRLEDATRVLLRAVEPPAPLLRAHDALATLYTLAGCGDAALSHARIYADRLPDSGYAQIRLAIALSLRGRLEECRAARLRALELGLTRACDWTSAIHMMLCDTAEDGEAIARVAARAVEPIAPRRPTPARSVRSSAGQRLRIGYLSPEFGVPPGAFFLDPLLLGHDRSRVEVFLYDTRRQAASNTADRARLGEHLCEVGWLDDDAIADRIEADRIDVLVELSSHFPDSRVPVLARRAAPIQATLPQCPATTGCREVDYLFTDRWTSPPGTEREYVERLCHLPSGSVVYTPPAAAPPSREAPVTRSGVVTFGLLQRFAKIGADVWDALAEVLRATPHSRLVLHNGDGELVHAGSATSRFLRDQLAIRDVDPGRLRLVGPMPLPAHLDLVSGIDVALDTWPYSGTTTTCECLWMGVPVVTLSGRTHASRVSAGLLRRCGLDHLVAGDAAGYVAIATRVAEDVDGLVQSRLMLRRLMVERGLTDGRALAAAAEAAYGGWVRPGAGWP